MPRYRTDFAKLYTVGELPKNDQGEIVCYYCNALAQHLDHVPALYVIATLFRQKEYDKIMQSPLVVVPSCKQCNNKLGSKPLMTLEARKEYIELNATERVRKYKGHLDIRRLSYIQRARMIDKIFRQEFTGVTSTDGLRAFIRSKPFIISADKFLNVITEVHGEEWVNDTRDIVKDTLIQIGQLKYLAQQGRVNYLRWPAFLVGIIEPFWGEVTPKVRERVLNYVNIEDIWYDNPIIGE